jgi:PadR family transcriptional regulator, regulatory protein PadR
MPRHCRHHNGEGQHPCSCEMGNIYRFAEPIVLLAIAKLKEAHGYQISQEAEQLAVTHAGLDAGAIYRVLRRLEENGHVESRWETTGEGPARRVYTLNATGLQHLNEWVDVLEELTRSLYDLTSQCRKATVTAAPIAPTKKARAAK